MQLSFNTFTRKERKYYFCLCGLISVYCFPTFIHIHTHIHTCSWGLLVDFTHSIPSIHTYINIPAGEFEVRLKRGGGFLFKHTLHTPYT